MSLGLNFIPVPQLPLNTTIQSYFTDQWKDFKRRLNIQYFFLSQKHGKQRPSSLQQFRIRSTWEPDEEKDFTNPPYSPIVKGYLQSVKTNLLSSCSNITQKHSDTLTQYQNPRWLIPALRELRMNESIIVTQADKNMGIVVIDLQTYQTEGIRQLNSFTTYDSQPEPTYQNVTSTISPPLFQQKYSLLRMLLNKYGHLYKVTYRSNKELSDLAKYLLQLQKQHTNMIDIRKVSAKFYLLMKMHKNPVVGRPIVSTINSFTYHVSVYVDAELKPLLKLIPSYIESSQQLIYLLEHQSFPSDCYICCADIESLYPNIPIDKGIEYVTKAIRRLSFLLPGSSVPLRDDSHHVLFIVDLMTWVLKNNYFMFGNQWYHQLQGTAMGTPLAVPFACLFVCQLEHELFSQQRDGSYLAAPLFYKRYIDDIFYIARSTSEANKFFDCFRQIIPSIRCGSLTIDATTGIFLDIQVYKGSRFLQTGVFDFKTYQKEQNRYLYLAPNSFHRRNIFASFIISELNRYRLSCTDTNEFYTISSLFYQRLVARGYNPHYLNAVFASVSSRDKLLSDLSHRYRTQHASNSSFTTNTKSVPLLFKSLNTYETAQVKISKATRISLQIQAELSNNIVDSATTSILSTHPTTCHVNSATSYTIVGNARKTLYQR